MSQPRVCVQQKSPLALSSRPEFDELDFFEWYIAFVCYSVRMRIPCTGEFDEKDLFVMVAFVCYWVRMQISCIGEFDELDLLNDSLRLLLGWHANPLYRKQSLIDVQHSFIFS